jgi:hypothetical protein
LKAADWNRMTVVLKGDTITLILNDKPIYERILEPTNNRQFGFFHYADSSEARVRKVVYDGTWLREVPPDLGFPLAGPG